MKIVKTDVCVLGAGAGGFGCIYRLIKNGIKTIVVDKNNNFGGTAVFCGVSGWEPGVSLDGVHTVLKDELERLENGCCVLELVPNCNIFDSKNGMNWDNHSISKNPWGLSYFSDSDYSETLKRCKFIRGSKPVKRFQFDEASMMQAMNNVLKPYKDMLTTYFGYKLCGCVQAGKKVQFITVSNEKEEVKIYAKYFVDATGNIALAREAGCSVALGSEGKEQYNEPSAGNVSNNVNGVTYVFRVTKVTDRNHIDNIPQWCNDIDINNWKNTSMKNTVSCFSFYPNNDININMLPTMQGYEYLEYGSQADEVGCARVHAYWNYLQTERNMKGYTLIRIFDAGVRESYRLVGRYVLTENDIRAGMLRQPKVGRTIAIADHALDMHGNGGMCKELEYPYEIPLECTMPKEFDNLFTACCGASFSHIAAASVRLTRTMLSIGEGVGEYITECLSV